MSCPVCGGENECHLTHGQMGDIDFLTVEDWRQIYQFMRDVQIPFMHKIIARAARRTGIDMTRWRKSKMDVRRLERIPK